MIALPLLLLTGCDALVKARDTLDGILDPVVVEGIVLGVEAPQGAGIDTIFANSEYQAGTAVTLFMADAQEVQDLENAPIAGAVVAVNGVATSGEVPEVEAGVYLREPNGELIYEPEAAWELSVSRTSGDTTVVSSAVLNLPLDSDFSTEIPAMHTQNTAIDLDFTGLGYDAALVVVLDDGGVAYSNEPKTIREVYDFTHGNGDLGLVTVPADTFDAESVYLVGVAGMVNTRAADLTEMNTALSTVMMGKMRFYAVSTVTPPAL